MAILVTGGAGHTGSHVCIELINQEYDVVVVDNFLTSTVNTFKNIKKVTGKSPRLYAMDLGHKELVKRIFEENDIEGVIHFAGIKSKGAYTNNPIQYYYTNLASTLMLCETMQDYGVKKMLFSSSEGFYGDNGSNTSTYGSAKIMIERILQEIYGSDPEWGIMIMRYLKKEDHVYTRAEIKVEDMSKVYISAFKQIKKGEIKTEELSIKDKSIITKSIENYEAYKL